MQKINSSFQFFLCVNFFVLICVCSFMFNIHWEYVSFFSVCLCMFEFMYIFVSLYVLFAMINDKYTRKFHSFYDCIYDPLCVFFCVQDSVCLYLYMFLSICECVFYIIYSIFLSIYIFYLFFIVIILVFECAYFCFFLF